MPNNQDANIKLLYPVDAGSFFTADTVENGKQFDVIANVEIGKDLREIATQEKLFVSVVNLSTSELLLQGSDTNVLTPSAAGPLNQELRIQFAKPWNAADGDVLEAIATYKVTAGVYTDYSTSRTATFVVTV